uniref:DJ-1/PfpI domain-containing protein n=1 Tax=Megaselia scalaris TaxID=36166 RepID=T1H3Q0_MEGSC
MFSLTLTSVLKNNFRIKSCYFSTNLLRMSKTACVILADGAEEMEFVIAADILRRTGINVTVAGLSGDEPTDFDVIVMPGGLGGSKAMASSSLVGEILKRQESGGRFIAAICAAPIALKSHGIANGKKITSYPSFKNDLCEAYCYDDQSKVVQDGQLITSRGPATAFDFGLKIASALAGEDKAKEVAKAMLIQ